MVYTYKLKSGRRTSYIGSSKAPKKRAVQHIRTGKKFTSLEITSKNLTRKKAEEKEKRDLKKFIIKNGKRPKYNKTNDGKYHYGGKFK